MVGITHPARPLVYPTQRRSSSESFASALRRTTNGFWYGTQQIACETCGTRKRADRAVWRGLHPYCSAQHEADDLV